VNVCQRALDVARRSDHGLDLLFGHVPLTLGRSPDDPAAARPLLPPVVDEGLVTAGCRPTAALGIFGA